MRVLVKDVMTKTVLKLQKNWTIKQAAQLFVERLIDGAPVVDDQGKVIGLFTKTHLMKCLGKSLDTTVETLMNRNVITINQAMPVEEALSIPVGRLPVVNDQGVMVGWLTRTDLANSFLVQYEDAMERLAAVMDSTFNAIIAIDEKGIICTFNAAAERLFGVQAEVVLDKAISDCFPNVKLMDVLRTGRPRFCLPTEINGLPMEANITPVIRKGQIVGAVVVFQNFNQ